MTMYWEEPAADEQRALDADVVDVVFGITCPTLPVDHAFALSQAIERALPWFAGEATAGLHLVHGADSGNGWARPDAPQALIHLSRRTKLALRVPKARADDAGALRGRTLDVDGHVLRVDTLVVRALARITTLFSRHVSIPGCGEEVAFVEAARGELGALDIRPRKMLCGLTTYIATPARMLQTRSLLLAGLTLEESLRLQAAGLGAARKLGCGLFLPHKDIEDVRRRPA